MLKALGGKYFLGVNYSAMHKYPAACSPEQWQNAAASVKVSGLAPLAQASCWLHGKVTVPCMHQQEGIKQDCLSLACALSL